MTNLSVLVSILKDKRSKEIKTLFEEKDFDFFQYVNNSGLLKKDSDVLFLTTTKHFYYHKEELEKVDIIINTKKLNYISKLDDYIYMLYKMLSGNTIFYGCFLDNKTPLAMKGPNKYLKFLESIMSIVDTKTIRLLSKKNIEAIFKSYNFEIINMEDVNDVTYFYCKKVDY